MIRYFIYLTAFLIPQLAFAQLNFNFENGNLTQWQQSRDNSWETSKINPINGLYSLHHDYDNPASGNDQISIAYSQPLAFTDTITWEFRVKYNYNPSSGNNWAVFLASEQPAALMIPGALNPAIVVGVNFTGSDDLLKIWQIENGINTVALQTTINWEDVVGIDSAAYIKITRTPDSTFWLSIAPSGIASKAIQVGSIKIKNLPKPTYFGIYYKYTSTQDRKLWIDDITVNAKFISDTIAPKIDKAYISSNNSITIVFNESINVKTLSIENCKVLNPDIKIASFEFLKNNTLVIKCYSDINQGIKINVLLKNIADIYGNTMPDKELIIINYTAKTYDVLINEIMADPSPTISLPECEYIELYNKTEFPINISKWKIRIGKTSYSVPEEIIEAKGYVILCSSKSTSMLSKYGKAVEVWSSDQILTNAGNTLLLSDSTNKPMAFANYSDDWYSDNYKKSGGWSLEMIDPANPCGMKENWKASKNKSGGTPGSINSVAGTSSDNIGPELVSYAVPNDSTVIVNFSETLNFSILNDIQSFTIDNGENFPKIISFNNQQLTSLRLVLNKKLEAGKIYSLKVKPDVCDCSANKLTSEQSYTIALPAPIDSFDIVINEILFNPFSFCAGFLELYNRSNKVVDAGSLILATIDTMTNSIKAFTLVADTGTLLMPESYLLISKNVDNLRKYYSIKSSGNLIDQTDFLTFDDKHGIVAIMKKDMSVIDKFEYNSKMHNLLINNSEGVSLERLSTNTITNNLMNWQSAAQTAGNATPGYKNSQSSTVIESGSPITISPEVFSPNSDTRDDFVNIIINQEYKQYTASIKIYNPSGVCIKNLALKQYLGTSNQFVWNGTADNNSIAMSGIYVIHIMLFSEKGVVKEFKKTCVLVKN